MLGSVPVPKTRQPSACGAGLMRPMRGCPLEPEPAGGKPACDQAVLCPQLPPHTNKQKTMERVGPTPGLNNPRGNNIGAHHQPTAGYAHADRRDKPSCTEKCCVNQLPAAQVGADGVKTLCGKAGPDQKPAEHAGFPP